MTKTIQVKGHQLLTNYFEVLGYKYLLKDRTDGDDNYKIILYKERPVKEDGMWSRPREFNSVDVTDRPEIRYVTDQFSKSTYSPVRIAKILEDYAIIDNPPVEDEEVIKLDDNLSIVDTSGIDRGTINVSNLVEVKPPTNIEVEETKPPYAYLDLVIDISKVKISVPVSADDMNRNDRISSLALSGADILKYIDDIGEDQMNILSYRLRTT